MTVEFSCDLNRKGKPLHHFWEHTVGSGHGLLALRSDWQAQLRRCHDELGLRHVRFHGLLSDDVGAFVIEQDKPVYSFFNSDRIFDFLLSIGMRPFVELSFMPQALSSGSDTVFHYRGNITPPADYKLWAALIHKLVRHWVDRYGINEVREWFFEVWNEPNLKAFWTGSLKDYFRLYRTTVHAIKEVDSSLRVGGPATAQNAWIPEFIDFCEKNDLRADFISTHYYPTDAFGKEDTDTTSQLADAPHGVMRQRAKETHRHAKGRPVYYTEWSISSNPRDHFHDESFAAALATNIVMNVAGLVDGFSYWTFSDIFEENYFPSKPFHGGFGMMNLYGVPKPVYRAFEVLHHLGSEQRSVKGSHKTVSAWIVTDKRRVDILLTNHAMPQHPIKTEVAIIKLKNVAEPVTAHIQRIDSDHANPRSVWREMGKPEYLNNRQVDQLEAASSIPKRAQPFSFEGGNAQLEISLPPHSVAVAALEL
jgi:xylan 1,4-beta-xylosidase